MLWPLADHLGTTNHLARYDGGTDTTSVVSHYQIDSFGNVTALEGAVTDTRYLFTAQEYDPALSTYYYDARWYDPRVGKFISEDPIGFTAGDANLERYVGNAATMATDPEGLQTRDPFGNWAPGSGYNEIFGEMPHAAPAVLVPEAEEVVRDEFLFKAKTFYCDKPGELANYGSELIGPAVGPSLRTVFLGLSSDRLVDQRTYTEAVVWHSVYAQDLAEYEARKNAWRQMAWLAGSVIGSVVVPGAGEALDIQVLSDPCSPAWSKLLSAASLAISVPTLGATMNWGAFVSRVDNLVDGSQAVFRSFTQIADDTFAMRVISRYDGGWWNANRASQTRLPDLPAFDGQTTHAILVSRDGRVLQRFSSGNKSPAYSNYASAGHAEGKAAIWMRENGVTDAVLYHNNPSGTCNWCHPQVSTLLPEGATMQVVPPAGTVIPSPRWHVRPEPYVGNSRVPKTTQP